MISALKLWHIYLYPIRMKLLSAFILLMMSATVAHAQVKITELGTYKEPPQLQRLTRMNVVLHAANMNPKKEADWKALKTYADYLLSHTPGMYNLTIFFVKTDTPPDTYPVSEGNLPWALDENTLLQVRTYTPRTDAFKRCAWIEKNTHTFGAFPPGAGNSGEWCLEVIY